MSESFVPSFGNRAAELVARTGAEDQSPNPAKSQGDRIEEQAVRRIPMSAPQAKLATPSIPGFHLHWMNDVPGRLAQAKQGGYEFVLPEETQVNSRDLAGDSTLSGSTDMGTRVSVVVGQDEHGNPLRAYLMKIREEWYKQDQADQQNRVDDIDMAMRQGKQSTGGADATNRYVKAVNLKTSLNRSA